MPPLEDLRYLHIYSDIGFVNTKNSMEVYAIADLNKKEIGRMSDLSLLMLRRDSYFKYNHTIHVDI